VWGIHAGEAVLFRRRKSEEIVAFRNRQAAPQRERLCMRAEGGSRVGMPAAYAAERRTGAKWPRGRCGDTTKTGRRRQPVADTRVRSGENRHMRLATTPAPLRSRAQRCRRKAI